MQFSFLPSSYKNFFHQKVTIGILIFAALFMCMLLLQEAQRGYLVQRRGLDPWQWGEVERVFRNDDQEEMQEVITQFIERYSTNELVNTPERLVATYRTVQQQMVPTRMFALALAIYIFFGSIVYFVLVSVPGISATDAFRGSFIGGVRALLLAIVLYILSLRWLVFFLLFLPRQFYPYILFVLGFVVSVAELSPMYIASLIYMLRDRLSLMRAMSKSRRFMGEQTLLQRLRYVGRFFLWLFSFAFVLNVSGLLVSIFVLGYSPLGIFFSLIVVSLTRFLVIGGYTVATVHALLPNMPSFAPQHVSSKNPVLS